MGNIDLGQVTVGDIEHGHGCHGDVATATMCNVDRGQGRYFAEAIVGDIDLGQVTVGDVDYGYGCSGDAAKATVCDVECGHGCCRDLVRATARMVTGTVV